MGLDRLFYQTNLLVRFLDLMQSVGTDYITAPTELQGSILASKRLERSDIKRRSGLMRKVSSHDKWGWRLIFPQNRLSALECVVALATGG